MTFGGFAIYGNTQTTTELRCPNGAASSPGIKGDFGPNFYIGALPSIIKDPNSGNDPNKRDTALTVFCNRSGPTLSTAKCTASLSDTGAAPRSLPSGSIDWTATEGFSPATASCFPTQVSFSPGVGACEVEFAVPDGFTIGAKFPISVTYEGDTNFNGSAAGHKLINPKCVSTDLNKPCPNSIRLTFTGTPSVIKEKIKAFVLCGGTTTDATRGGACHVSGVTFADISKILQALTFNDAKALGQLISQSDAKKDTLLYYLRNVDKVGTELNWKSILADDIILVRIADYAARNSNSVRKKDNPWEEFIQNSLPASKAKAKFNKSLKSEIIKVDVKPDKQKNLTMKLPKRIGTLIGLYKKAGLPSIPLSVTLTAKQDKRKGKATVTESVDFAVE